MNWAIRIVGVVSAWLPAIGLSMPVTQAACLPGQSCWQAPQTTTPVKPGQPGKATLQRQYDEDRSQTLRDQQQLDTDRSRLHMPLGNPTPLDRANQRQDIRSDKDKLWQSQKSLQRSQELLQEQNRPPAPRPYATPPAIPLP